MMKKQKAQQDLIQSINNLSDRIRWACETRKPGPERTADINQMFAEKSLLTAKLIKLL